MKQYLLKLTVQAVWVTIDENGDAVEVPDRTLALPPKEIRPFIDRLFEFAEKAKRAEDDGASGVSPV